MVKLVRLALRLAELVALHLAFSSLKLETLFPNAELNLLSLYSGYHAKALFASCPVSLCPTTELFYSSIEQGSDDLNYRRNTLNTLFRPRITSLCHDVCDTLMSWFSALAQWRGRLLRTGYSPFLRPVVVGGGRVVWGCICGAGVGGGGARARPAAGRVAHHSCPAPAMAPFPVQGRSSLWTVSCCWGGWPVLLLGCDACRTVGGCLQSGAALISVRLNVGSLPIRSSSPTVAGCLLGGFPVGRDLWGGELIVGGVLPRINIGTWGLCDSLYCLCLVLVCRGRYGRDSGESCQQLRCQVVCLDYQGCEADLDSGSCAQSQ
jgi:hypothetical protein